MTLQFIALTFDVVVFGWFIFDGVRLIDFSRGRLAAKRLFVLAQAASGMVALLGVYFWLAPLELVGVFSGVGLWYNASKLIGLTGGVEPIDGLAYAYRELAAFAKHKPRMPLSSEDQAWLARHLAGLERWRSPETNEFIDLWREVAVAEYVGPRPEPTTWNEMNERLVEQARRLWSERH